VNIVSPSEAIYSRWCPGGLGDGVVRRGQMTWPIPIGTRGEDVNPPGAFPLWLGTFGDEIFGCGVERDDRVQGIDTEALDGSNVHEAAIDSHMKISSVTYRTHLREYSLMTYHHIASGLGGCSAGSREV
jgi:hypothetical protein